MNKCIRYREREPYLRYVDRYVPDPGCYNISY